MLILINCGFYHLPVTSSDGHFDLEKIDSFFEKKYYWNFGYEHTSENKKETFKKVGNIMSR